MMKTILLTLSIALLLSTVVTAQNTDPKHKNFYKIPNKVDGKDYILNFKNIVAKIDYAKMAVDISNTGKDYLMFIAEESEIVFDFGIFNSKEDVIFILPNTMESKTLKATGDNRFHVDEFKINFAGLYHLSATEKIQKVEEFCLPASKNNISAGNFKISLIKMSQRTQETYGKFEIEYIGDEVGIIDPSKLSVRVDGTELIYANDVKKNKSSILSKGGPVFLRKGEKLLLRLFFIFLVKLPICNFLFYILCGAILLLNLNLRRLIAMN